MINKVEFNLSKKELKKLPDYIYLKLLRWAKQVELVGLKEVQKSPGWRDEQLEGKRKGQRSIRLNRSYRAIYIIKGEKVLVILEANKHDY